MKLEDQVCSFEQAQHLEKHGVNLDTYFKWVDFGDKSFVRPSEARNVFPIFTELLALTVAELGALLPSVVIRGDRLNLRLEKGELSNLWFAFYESNKCREKFYDYFVGHQNEAQARAAALIWLLENGYLKAGDLKL